MAPEWLPPTTQGNQIPLSSLALASVSIGVPPPEGALAVDGEGTQHSPHPGMTSCGALGPVSSDPRGSWWCASVRTLKALAC